MGKWGWAWVAVLAAAGCYDDTGDDDTGGIVGDDGGGDAAADSGSQDAAATDSGTQGDAATDSGPRDAATDDGGSELCGETDAQAGIHWDADHDGFVSADCGGDDCNDDDAVTHPGAPDGTAPWSVHEFGGSDAEPAIAVDGAGRTYVSTAGLVRSSADGLDWSWDRDRYIGHFAYVPLAIDEDDGVHIVYQESAGDLSGEVQHATFAGGEWSTEVALAIERIDSSHERSAGLAIDPAGALHAVLRLPVDWPFDRDVDVTYLTNQGGAWTEQRVDADASGRASVGLAVDASGAAHIGYPWTAPDVPAEVRYATNASGAWVVETVVAADWIGAVVAIALDDGGAPHLVFDDEAGALQHADRSSGAWALDEIDAEGRGASMAADAAGLLHVAYQKEAGIWYAQGGASAWTTEVVQPQLAQDAYARDVNLALDPAGEPRIVFIDQIDEGLYYAIRSEVDGVDQNCDGVDGLANP